eukprot:3320028-Pyramimonas_sp.AAC.1
MRPPLITARVRRGKRAPPRMIITRPRESTLKREKRRNWPGCNLARKRCVEPETLANDSRNAEQPTIK